MKKVLLSYLCFYSLTLFGMQDLTHADPTFLKRELYKASVQKKMDNVSIGLYLVGTLTCASVSATYVYQGEYKKALVYGALSAGQVFFIWNKYIPSRQEYAKREKALRAALEKKEQRVNSEH